MCSLPEGEGKGSSSFVAAGEGNSPRNAAPGTCVWPCRVPHSVSPGTGAGLSSYTWKQSPAGHGPGRGCNPAPCWGWLGSEDIPLIKMFIELLETLTRQRCKSGISTRCVELYSEGSREAAALLMAHKEMHPTNGDSTRRKAGAGGGSGVVTLSYERFLQEKVQISFCQGRLEADW